jgi:hypothetical protein
VATTVFSEVLITDTDAPNVLVTYILLPSGLEDTPMGSKPTLIVATNWFVDVLITEIVFKLTPVRLCVLVIYAKPFALTGVAVIVAVTGTLPVLIALKDAMLPVPLEGSPIEGLSLIQLYTHLVPGKLVATVFAPFSIVWFCAQTFDMNKKIDNIRGIILKKLCI